MSEPIYITNAYNALSEAFAAWGVAWGPTDGLHALPQAIQLEARIAAGKEYITAHPDDGQARRHLLQLRQQYSKALDDSADQRRCARFREAEEKYRYLEAQYLALVRVQRKAA
jgi:cation diffusion facilitator CzcD-associated flavoprotein CzcO